FVYTLLAKKRKPRKKVSKKSSLSPAETLLKTVHDILKDRLKHPMKEEEIATLLGTSIVQTRAWLKRLMEEGRIEKQTRPARYFLAPERLFE
ncbi:FaeA/PapI family transcriptional regulator, partial [Pseudomonas cannabina]